MDTETYERKSCQRKFYEHYVKIHLYFNLETFISILLVLVTYLFFIF